MKKKILGIVVCMLLIIAVLPVTGSLTSEYDADNKIILHGDRFYEIDFMIGKIHDLNEEIKNDTIRYSFHVDWILIIIHAYFPPISFTTKRILDRDSNLSIPKNNFHGLIKEGRIFGIWESITL